MRTLMVTLASAFLALGCDSSVSQPGDPGRGDEAAIHAGRRGPDRLRITMPRRGCRWDCPKCRPGEPCALRPCELVCPPEVEVPCGDATCGAGEFCCNESCGICAPLGGACTEQFCGPEPIACGPSVCGEGELCCNESCGICTPLGGVCTKQLCGGPVGTPCGTVTCGGGEYCCNPSCGICAPEGGVCTQQACEPVPPPVSECTTHEDCRLFSDYCEGCECKALASGEPDPVCAGPGVRCFADPCRDQHAVCVDGGCTTVIY